MIKEDKNITRKLIRLELANANDLFNQIDSEDINHSHFNFSCDGHDYTAVWALFGTEVRLFLA